MAITSIASATAKMEVKATINQLGTDSVAQLMSGQVPGSGQGRVNHTFADGSDPDQADRAWAGAGELAFGVSEDIDLNALTGQFGETISLTKVKAILIRNVSTANNGVVPLEVGGAAANEWLALLKAAGDKLALPDDSCSIGAVNHKDGWAVAGASKILRIKNIDGALAAKWECIIIGLE